MLTKPVASLAKAALALSLLGAGSVIQPEESKWCNNGCVCFTGQPNPCQIDGYDGQQYARSFFASSCNDAWAACQDWIVQPEP